MAVRQNRTNPNKGAAERTKVTFSLPREVISVLRTLAQERGTSMTDVLRQAVTTEKYLSDAQKDGFVILLENARSGTTRQLVLR